jgi:hypothetical protein
VHDQEGHDAGRALVPLDDRDLLVDRNSAHGQLTQVDAARVHCHQSERAHHDRRTTDELEPRCTTRHERHESKPGRDERDPGEHEEQLGHGPGIRAPGDHV